MIADIVMFSLGIVLRGKLMQRKSIHEPGRKHGEKSIMGLYFGGYVWRFKNLKRDM